MTVTTPNKSKLEELKVSMQSVLDNENNEEYPNECVTIWLENSISEFPEESEFEEEFDDEDEAADQSDGKDD